MPEVVLIAMNDNASFNDSEYLGLEAILASLSINGIDAAIHHESYTHIDNVDATELAIGIMKHKPSIIGMGVYYSTCNKMNELAGEIKKINPNIHIVMGGIHATQAPVDLLEYCSGVDSIIIGEGEFTFPELAKRVLSSSSLEGCKGVVCRNGNSIVLNEAREKYDDLDCYPKPERAMLKNKKYGYARIQTSRGCIGNCAFCIESKGYSVGDGKRWRGRSPENVVKELEEIVRDFGISTFVITDNSFEDPGEAGKQRVTEICNLMLKRTPGIFFTALFRAESFSEPDNELIQLMKRAGLVYAFIGAESGYDRTLQLFGKRASVSQNIKAVKSFQNAGIAVDVGFIMFHPYSTLEEAEANLEFLKKTRQAHRFSVFQNHLMLFHGAPIAKRIADDKLLSDEFSVTNPYGYIIADSTARWLAHKMMATGISEGYSPKLFELENYCAYIETLLVKAKSTGEDYKMLDYLDETYAAARDRIEKRNVAFFENAIRISGKISSSNDSDEFNRCIDGAFGPEVVQKELNILTGAVRKFLCSNMSNGNSSIKIL